MNNIVSSQKGRLVGVPKILMAAPQHRKLLYSIVVELYTGEQLNDSLLGHTLNSSKREEPFFIPPPFVVQYYAYSELLQHVLCSTGVDLAWFWNHDVIDSSSFSSPIDRRCQCTRTVHHNAGRCYADLWRYRQQVLCTTAVILKLEKPSGPF